MYCVRFEIIFLYLHFLCQQSVHNGHGFNVKNAYYISKNNYKDSNEKLNLILCSDVVDNDICVIK